MGDSQIDVARIGPAALAVGVMLGAIDAGFITATKAEPHGLALAAVSSCGIFLCLWVYLSFNPPRRQAAAYNGAVWPTLAIYPAVARDIQLSSGHVAPTRACHGHSAAIVYDHDPDPARRSVKQETIAHNAQPASASQIDRALIAALHAFAASLAGGPNLEAILRNALHVAAECTGSRHGTVLVLDETGQHIRYRVALDSGNIAPLELVAGPMMSKGLVGWVVRERQASMVVDTEQDSRWLPGPGLGDLRSALVAPLLHGDRVLGVITLAHDAPGHYVEQHLQLLEILGAQAALALDRARLVQAPQDEARYLASPADVLTLYQANEREELELSRVDDVVVVAAKLRDLVGACARLDPAVMFEQVLDVYVQALTVIVGRRHGSVMLPAGEAMLALFGHPRPRPDAAMCAVQAALEMQDAVRRLLVEWRTRFGVEIGGLDIGIARGPVVVGGLGALPERYATALGDAVNRAVRLRDLARTGEILAAAEVATALDPAGALCVVEALQPLCVRGLAPEHIYRIGEPGRRKPAN